MSLIEEAVESLTKANITELRSYIKPPKSVENVLCAVCVLLNVEQNWATANKLLNNPSFLQMLVSYDVARVDSVTLDKLKVYTSLPEWQYDYIKNSSRAASCLFKWVNTIVVIAENNAKAVESKE